MSAAIECPRCARPFVELRGIELCVGCGGVFVAGAAARALEAAAQDVAALADTRPFRRVHVGQSVGCPVCGQPMHRRLVGTVEVDTCDADGTWYDRGELLALTAARAAAIDDDALRLVSAARIAHDKKKAAAIEQLTLPWWVLDVLDGVR